MPPKAPVATMTSTAAITLGLGDTSIDNGDS